MSITGENDCFNDFFLFDKMSRPAFWTVGDPLVFRDFLDSLLMDYAVGSLKLLLFQDGAPLNCCMDNCFELSFGSIRLGAKAMFV